MDQYGTIKFNRNPWGLWPSPMKDEMSPSHFGVSTESTKCSWFDRVGAVADRLLADVPTSPTTLGDISSPWRSTCNKDQQGLIHQPLLNTMLLLLSVLSDSATAVNWYLHLTQKLLVPLSFPLNNPIKPSSWLSLLVLHNVFAAHWDTSSPPILSEGKCIQLPETPGRQSKLLTVSLPVWMWDDFRCEMMCNALHCSIANARINQLTAIGDACHMLTSNLASQNMFNHGMQYIINYYIVHIYSYLFIHV